MWRRPQSEAATILAQGPTLLHGSLWQSLTFNRHGVVDSRLRFDMTLPALPEEVIEQTRGVLHAVDDLDCPYVALKARLLDLFTSKPLDQCFKLIFGGELGDGRPSQLMESILALLPPGRRTASSSKRCSRPSCPARSARSACGGPGRWPCWLITSGSPGTSTTTAQIITRRWQQSCRTRRSSRRPCPRSTCSPSGPSPLQTHQAGRQARSVMGDQKIPEMFLLFLFECVMIKNVLNYFREIYQSTCNLHVHSIHLNDIRL